MLSKSNYLYGHHNTFNQVTSIFDQCFFSYFHGHTQRDRTENNSLLASPLH